MMRGSEVVEVRDKEKAGATMVRHRPSPPWLARHFPSLTSLSPILIHSLRAQSFMLNSGIFMGSVVALGFAQLVA